MLRSEDEHWDDDKINLEFNLAHGGNTGDSLDRNLQEAWTN